MESPDGEDVSVIATLYPKENIVFETAIDQILTEVAGYADPKFEFTGFYLDEADHTQGYVFGIKLLDLQEDDQNGGEQQ